MKHLAEKGRYAIIISAAIFGFIAAIAAPTVSVARTFGLVTDAASTPTTAGTHLPSYPTVPQNSI